MAKDSAEGMAEETQVTDELRELREVVLDLGKALKGLGKSRLAGIGEDVSEEAREMVQEANRALRKAEQRIGRIEKRAEKSVHDHPGAWATGLLGVVGFGLVLGLILRRHD